MSFTTADSIMEMVENLLNYVWPTFVDTIPRKFPKIKYDEAMEYYGSDKPDISFEFKVYN